MNNIQKRFVLFLGGCIPARLFLAYIAKKGNSYMRQSLGVLTFMIASGFLIIYFWNLRQTGVETGGEKIWWNYLRPFHAFMYYYFTYSILFGDKENAWKILIMDTAVGLLSFFSFHLQHNSFSKLF